MPETTWNVLLGVMGGGAVVALLVATSFLRR